MELFTKTVNNGKPLFILVKKFNSRVWLGSEFASENDEKYLFPSWIKNLNVLEKPEHTTNT